MEAQRGKHYEPGTPSSKINRLVIFDMGWTVSPTAAAKKKGGISGEEQQCAAGGAARGVWERRLQAYFWEYYHGILPRNEDVIGEEAGGHFVGPMGVGARDFSGNFQGFREETTRLDWELAWKKPERREAHVFLCKREVLTKRFRGSNEWLRRRGFEGSNVRL